MEIQSTGHDHCSVFPLNTEVQGLTKRLVISGSCYPTVRSFETHVNVKYRILLWLCV